MARKRMFCSEITETDSFYDMPAGSQALYFHMGMLADDLGVISSPKKILRSMNVSDDELKILLSKKYLLPIGENLLVITDWLLHNTIRWDRFTPTIYQKEFNKLRLAGKSYSLTEGNPVNLIPEKKTNGKSNILDKLFDQTIVEENIQKNTDGNQMATKWQPDGNLRLPQSSLDKSNIVNLSLGQSITDMTEMDFITFIHNFNELDMVDSRLFQNLKKLLLNNNKETLNIVEYVNFIYSKMKSYSPHNPSAYFCRCILDLESIKKFENLKTNTTAKINLEDYSIECPACHNMINQYDDCPYCQLRKDDSKDEMKIILHQKYFNLSAEEKSKYDDEVSLIYKNIPLHKATERELAKSELNKKYGLI